MNEKNEHVNNGGKSKIVLPDRREILRMGLLGAGAGALSLALGSTNVLAQTKNMKPDPKNDIELINGAIRLEQKAINTYQAAADNKLLPTRAFLDVALQFAADHTAHREALKRAISGAFRATPAGTENLGTFPIPQKVLKGTETDVIRYALTLEMIASKAYLDYVTNKLTTDEAKDLAATILPVENQHAAIYRAVLMVVLKDKGLDGDDKLVPFAFLDQQPTPPVPMA